MPGHDFCSLQENADISPAIAISFIVGSALLLQISLSSMSYCCEKIRKPEQEAEIDEIIVDSEEESEERMSLLRRS